jgi:DNA-binding HxlR family transcriptional regulator
MEFENTGGPGADAEASSESSLAPRTTMALGGLAIISMLVILIGTATGTSKRNRMESITEEDTPDVDDLLVLLSRSKMVQIIRVLHSAENPIRFTELKERVGTSSTTLTRRLGELEDYQLVERTELQTAPVTVVYKLTDSGSALLPSLELFFEWAIGESPDGVPK